MNKTTVIRHAQRRADETGRIIYVQNIGYNGYFVLESFEVQSDNPIVYTAHPIGWELNRANLILINRFFRALDESKLWPICGRFNATERAIKKLRINLWQYKYTLEYTLALENEISNIVNDSKNW